MLTTCPECELPVSDKAFSCPHCGYPLKQDKPQPRRTPKRMRLPNGFGQISELKGRNLRKPFRAMVTVGKTESGRPICKTLKPQGYFATYNDAYAALVEYNRRPYDLNDSVTVEELYDSWSARHYPTLAGESLKKSYKTAWKRCKQISTMRVVDVRPRHMKACIEEAPSPNTKRMVKILLNMMFDYAVEFDMAERNYARSFELEKTVHRQAVEQRQEHVAFSQEELGCLWAHVNDIPYADIILIQCYMGWRPKELGLLRIEDVNLDKGFIVGGTKTQAGTMRTVPIHSRIRPLVIQRYNEALSLDSKYLFNCTDSGNGVLTYAKYRVRFTNVMRQIGIEGHRPHDPRKTFVTLCKLAGVDEYAIKHMVGHAIADITESVYTERSVDWLAEELSHVK